MNKQQLVDLAAKEAGFIIMGTGGGCDAFCKEIGEGCEVLLVNDSHRPADLHEDDCGLGLYSDGEYICMLREGVAADLIAWGAEL